MERERGRERFITLFGACLSTLHADRDGWMCFISSHATLLPSSTSLPSRGKKGGRGEGTVSKKSGERRGKKVEEARGDGSAGANHLVCIHLRRILFLPGRSLGFLLLFLLFFSFPFFFATTPPLSLSRARDSSPHAKTDAPIRERKK